MTVHLFDARKASTYCGTLFTKPLRIGSVEIIDSVTCLPCLRAHIAASNPQTNPAARSRNIRRHPVTRRNSLVLGHDARTPTWRKWWISALWEDAISVGSETACLEVPGSEGDRKVCRVTPKIEGPGAAVKINGVWHWEYR